MSDSTPGVRLVVDGDRCQGHNRCNVLLPELIRIDDYGFAQVEGTGVVPPALADKARLAVRNCPEYALKLEPVTDEGRQV